MGPHEGCRHDRLLRFESDQGQNSSPPPLSSLA